ncbi:MAG: MBL fold metallo-hydrolase [Bacteroidetes bacterium]|jgi:glyoxylase-like metal-dependent hydrolase (beta-lactamase superfamily II)|nr:MBL fold metallo-hydrolase [Bacteroidota bacterium]
MKKLVYSGTGALLLALLLVACSGSKETKSPAASEVKVHQYVSSGAGIFENAYILELANGLVVVDATLTVSSSKELKAQIEKLGKPLKAVLITHGHPDHYNGLGNLVGKDEKVPIYSTQSVLDVIAESDSAKEGQWVSRFGKEWPMNRRFPNHMLRNDESVTIEGVKFQVKELGEGESHSDTYWLVDNGTHKLAFIGDVVLNGTHAYLADGHYQAWLDNLTRLQTDLKGVDTLYPGHGEPGGLAMLAWQKQYIETYVQNVKTLLANKKQLTDADKAELVKKMKEFLPSDKLEFLIAIGADAVAGQVASSK